MSWNWTPFARNWGALALLCLSQIAQAAPFSVESPSYRAREDADRERTEAIQAGGAPERTRIVRRYERGAGWRYLVHVDSVESQSELERLIGVLTDGERAPRVVDLATGAAVSIRPSPVTAGPAPATAATDAPSPVAGTNGKRSRRETEGVLAAAVAAHGGVAGGLKVLESSSLQTFQFVREVPSDAETLKAKHVYRQSGNALRLDVAVQRGDGVDSTTVVSPGGGAWVTSANQTVPRDTERTREILRRFAPDQLLRVALGVAGDIETAGAWRSLQVVGPEGDDLLVLRPSEEASGGLIEVAFSRTDHRLRRLVMEEGGHRTEFFFDDYRQVAPGLVVPHESETRRDGQLVESIQVIGIDVASPIPASLFAPNH